MIGFVIRFCAYIYVYLFYFYMCFQRCCHDRERNFNTSACAMRLQRHALKMHKVRALHKIKLGPNAGARGGSVKHIDSNNC